MRQGKFTGVLAMAGAVAISAMLAPAKAEDTIKIGVLHSLSGTMAISETTLKDTVLKVQALSGFTAVMNTNHHLSKPVMIGEIQPDGQFDVVWQTKNTIKADA